MTHNLKIRTCFADAILSGEKTFEVRYNGDRGFQKGDFVNFLTIDNNGNLISHSLGFRTYIITYVLSGFGLKEDYVVFGIKEVKENEQP